MKALKGLGLLGVAIACSSNFAEPGIGGEAGEGGETVSGGAESGGHAGKGGDAITSGASDAGAGRVNAGGDGILGAAGNAGTIPGAGGFSESSGGAVTDGGAAGSSSVCLAPPCGPDPSIGGEGVAGSDDSGPGIPPLHTWDGTLPAGVCSIDGWCWYDPLPAGNAVRDVWGASSTDVWAVGDRGTILHFDGQNWSGITGVSKLGGEVDPNDPDGIGTQLRHVHGSGPTDVWILGTRDQVLHWNGTKLVGVDYPEEVMPRVPSAIWAASPQSVWMTSAGGNLSIVSHFNGTSWQSSGLIAQTDLSAIWGFSDSDVWVAGGNIVKQWTGTEWLDRSAGLPATAKIVELWGATSAELFAVGPGIYRYSGGSWITLASGETPPFFVDVAGISPTQVVLVGTNGNLRSWDGSQLSSLPASGCPQVESVWCPQPTVDSPTPSEADCWFGSDPSSSPLLANGWKPCALETKNPVGAAHLSSDSLIVTAAVSPDVLYGVPPYTINGEHVLLRLDGRTETIVDTKTTGVWDVFGLSPSDVWVSADAGMTSHFDGATWTPYPVGGNITPSPGVRTNAAGEAFTAAWAPPTGFSTVYRFDGGSWNPEKTFSSPVEALAVGDSKAWAMLRDGSVWERGATDWTSILPAQVGLNFTTLDLGVDAKNRLWRATRFAFGKETDVRYYEGGSWHPSASEFLFFHMQVRGNEMWLFGGKTARFDGTEWLTYRAGSGTFETVSIAGPGDVWAWSEGGLVHFKDE